jgi:hypothetical protein
MTDHTHFAQPNKRDRRIHDVSSLIALEARKDRKNESLKAWLKMGSVCLAWIWVGGKAK